VSPFQLLLPTENPAEPFILVNRRPDISGDQLRRASQGFDPDGSGAAVVNFNFNTSGATIFCRLTQQNVRERFAVVLDNVVITAPSIRSPICGGGGFIEGNFTVQSASDLAALLNAGALPAELTIVEERTIGAILGEDNVEAGRNALIIGFIAVIVFMLAAYGVFGIFSNIALLLNVVLIAGALSGLGATLTLPGIAGIILTIGMAVDANVLIYERVREESRRGRPLMVFDMGDGALPWWRLRHAWRYKPLSFRLAMALGPRRMRRDIGRIEGALIEGGAATWLDETSAAAGLPAAIGPGGVADLNAAALQRRAAAVRELLKEH